MEKEGKQKNGGQPLNVLFTTGGGDSLHILPAIAEDLDKLLDGVTYHFLCGPLSEDGEKLTSMAQMYGPERMVVHGPQENMASFLNRFDLVVSAAGSTLYELCTLGIATIGFSFVENQVQNLAGFAQQVGMPTAGAFDQDMEKAKEKRAEEAEDEKKAEKDKEPKHAHHAKSVWLEADSEDELLEKIAGIDWDSIKGKGKDKNE